MPNTQNPQPIEKASDLGALLQNDVVKIQFKYLLSELVQEPRVGVYIGNSATGRMRVIVPNVSEHEKYITMYRFVPTHASVHQGTIVIVEDKAVIRNYLPKRDSEYKGFEEILIAAKLM